MATELICPILTAHAEAEHKKTEIKFFVECQKEECGWWVEDKQKCAITVMGEKTRHV